jgi:hypothetical protein
MKAFLRHHKRRSKPFFGVIGSHLIEILDDNPLIHSMLTCTNSSYIHTVSGQSRLVRPSKRMILKSHSDDALVILAHHDASVNSSNECTIRLFINDSKTSDLELVKDVLRLVPHRWSSLYDGQESYDLRNLKLPASKIQVLLSRLKNL